MKELAIAYIEKRIQKTRTKDSDSTVATFTFGSREYKAVLAKRLAQEDNPALTASFLNQDSLPDSFSKPL
jgi:hypothetical protein